MVKFKRVIFSALLSILMASLAFMVLQEKGFERSLHNANIIGHILIYALVPAIILGVFSMKDKNKLLLSLMIPVIWVFLVIVFFAYANDVLKYGISFSLYESKLWLFSSSRLVMLIIPALLQGFLFWILHTRFELKI